MKRFRLQLFLVASLLLVITVEGNADCLYSKGFVETYKGEINSDEVFFVKGVVIAPIDNGKKIKILEDLKGNFKENSSITLWKGMEGSDQAWGYSNNDTLLIMMTKLEHIFDSWSGQKIGDYCTLNCAFSILLYSKESVTGVINSFHTEATMLWREFELRLNEEYVQIIASTVDPTHSYLGQNHPNPFTGETMIPYFLPEGSAGAYLRIINTEGIVLQTVNITQTGESAIALAAHTLPPGVYFYSLLINGQTIDTKRMIVE